MELLILFIGLNIFNVIIQTVKSIATIKCGPGLAALVNAIAYGFYTVVIVYMVCDLPLWEKVLVVAACNLVGVYIVKILEKRSRKDKLWKVETTIPTIHAQEADRELSAIPHSYIIISNKHTLFNFYCETQTDSIKVKQIMDRYGAKYFASESKNF